MQNYLEWEGDRMVSNGGIVSEAKASSQPELASEVRAEQLQFIEFQLDSHIFAALETEIVQEVLSIKAQNVVPVPNMPSTVLGLMSRRGRVYWTIDLAMMLGLPHLSAEVKQYEVMILNVENLLLAVAVPKIKGMIKVSVNLVSTSTQSCPTTLKSYSKGSMTLHQEDQMRSPRVIYVLKAEAIARSGILHS
ncbi:chemotaxis protein CheW [Tumidithrix elongata RA019]|uniref:Chemotaxis protein CheW n=1 Tax=Tumidithrix elongata BACA0141 TaxID=2716417 RepID=A0AAW9PVB4_9CYAN|nr:chemotaxis protein CheW [Tumidithrix elongata RA019]